MFLIWFKVINLIDIVTFRYFNMLFLVFILYFLDIYKLSFNMKENNLIFFVYSSYLYYLFWY